MEKHNAVEPGKTFCRMCSALADTVIDGQPYCMDHAKSSDKTASAVEERLKNAADHLPKAE